MKTDILHYLVSQRILYQQILNVMEVFHTRILQVVSQLNLYFSFLYIK